MTSFDAETDLKPIIINIIIIWYQVEFTRIEHFEIFYDAKGPSNLQGVDSRQWSFGWAVQIIIVCIIV